MTTWTINDFLKVTISNNNSDRYVYAYISTKSMKSEAIIFVLKFININPINFVRVIYKIFLLHRSYYGT